MSRGHLLRIRLEMSKRDPAIRIFKGAIGTFFCISPKDQARVLIEVWCSRKWAPLSFQGPLSGTSLILYLTHPAEDDLF